MPIRDDPRAFLLAAVAPLTEALAFHLAGSYIKDVPRPIGRPSKAAGDVAARKEQRLRSALELILPSIAMEQEKVYALLDPLVRAGNLTKKWLLNELES